MKTNASIDDIVSNSIQDFGCKLAIVLPNVKWKFYDNREACEWCQRYFRQYSYISDKDIPREQRWRSKLYFDRLLENHFKATNAGEAHKDNDRSKAEAVLNKTYGETSLLETFAYMYGSMMGAFAGAFGVDVPIPKYGEVPQFSEISKFCSDRCKWESSKKR